MRVKLARRLGVCVVAGGLALAGASMALSLQDGTPVADEDALVARLADDQEGPAALRPAFNAFLAAMDRFDGPASLRLARAMHARSLAIRANAPDYDVIWSAFCLEGALRRSAPLEGPDRARHLTEARQILRALLDAPGCTSAQREALIQRLAILEAGFDQPEAERAALGGALALHGIDGAQITGLAALRRGHCDRAAALFATLLDSPDPARNDSPWGLRGHALAVLEGAPD